MPARVLTCRCSWTGGQAGGEAPACRYKHQGRPNWHPRSTGPARLRRPQRYVGWPEPSKPVTTVSGSQCSDHATLKFAESCC